MTTNIIPLGDIMTVADRRVPVNSDHFYPKAVIHSFARGLTLGDAQVGSETSYSHFNRLLRGDFVYQKLMAWEGGFAVVPRHIEGAFVSPECVIFKLDTSKVAVDYFTHLISWQPFWQQLASMAVGTNVRRRRLQSGQLLMHRVKLPSLQEQRNTASQLEIVNQASAIPTTSALRSLASELTDRLTANTHDTVVQLGEILSLNTQRQELAQGQAYKVSGMRGFGRGLFLRGEISADQTKYRFLHPLRTGQLAYSKLKAFEGAVDVVGRDHDGTFVSQEFPVFDLDKTRVMPGYLRCVVRGGEFRAHLRDLSRGLGSRRERVAPSAFLSLEIPLPGLERQDFAYRMLMMAEKIAALSSQRDDNLERLLFSARSDAFRSVLVS